MARYGSNIPAQRKWLGYCEAHKKICEFSVEEPKHEVKFTFDNTLMYVKCRCGWQGDVGELKVVSLSGMGVWNKDEFPVCPSCVRHYTAYECVYCFGYHVITSLEEVRRVGRQGHGYVCPACSEAATNVCVSCKGMLISDKELRSGYCDHCAVPS